MKRRIITLFALAIMAMEIFSGCTSSDLQDPNDTYSSTTSDTTTTTSETTTSTTTTATTTSDTLSSTIETRLSKQEALDAAKYCIAGDSDDVFEAVNKKYDNPIYKEKAKDESVYLAYNSYSDNNNGKYHLIHEYELVINDPKTGESHTASYNWYRVNDETGEITLGR